MHKHPLAVLSGVHRVKEGLNFKGQDSNSISAKYLGFDCIPCTHSFVSKFKKCLMAFYLAIAMVWHEKMSRKIKSVKKL